MGNIDNRDYSKILEIGRSLTRQIRQAEASNNQREVDRLLRRKAALIRIQADYVHTK